MNELMLFVGRNSNKLALADRQQLVRIANQIEALKREKDGDRKAAAIEAIGLVLDGLERIAQTKHYYGEGFTSLYVKPENRRILQGAIGFARKLLRTV